MTLVVLLLLLVALAIIAVVYLPRWLARSRPRGEQAARESVARAIITVVLALGLTTFGIFQVVRGTPQGWPLIGVGVGSIVVVALRAAREHRT